MKCIKLMWKTMDFRSDIGFIYKWEFVSFALLFVTEGKWKCRCRSSSISAERMTQQFYSMAVSFFFCLRGALHSREVAWSDLKMNDDVQIANISLYYVQG